MARSRQRISSSRWMQKRIETIADDTQHNHGSRAAALIVLKSKNVPGAPFVAGHRVRPALNER
jgi:hypothetical protein